MAGTDLSALIEDRLYAFESPQKDDNEEWKKTIVYRIIQTAHEAFIDGQYTEKSTFSFLCADSEYDGAHETADALIARLYSAVGQTFSGSLVQEVLLNDRLDDDANSSREAGVYTVYVEFSIQIR